MKLIQKALVLAGLVLAVSLGLTLAVRNGLIETDTMLRAQGVVAGLVLVLCANLVPKIPEPGSCLSKKQAVQRFAGWTLVLAGLGHMLAWLVLPIDLASPVAMSLVAAGVVLVAARVGLAFASGSSPQPPAEFGP